MCTDIFYKQLQALPQICQISPVMADMLDTLSVFMTERKKERKSTGYQLQMNNGDMSG